jgi:hypothetical protein
VALRPALSSGLPFSSYYFLRNELVFALMLKQNGCQQYPNMPAYRFNQLDRIDKKSIAVFVPSFTREPANNIPPVYLCEI